MSWTGRVFAWTQIAALLYASGFCNSSYAQVPILEAIFPNGAQAGHRVEVTVSGNNLNSVQTLRSNAPDFRCEKLGPSEFALVFSSATDVGQYDLWAVAETGISTPRTFVVGTRPELTETEPNEESNKTLSVPLGTVINGRCERPGDVDSFQFRAVSGQRVIIECSAERIDSRLRAVMEVFDSQGRRLAVNRGYFGIDPLIAFQVPAEGTYTVRIQDLDSAGSPLHYYRLEIDAGPRVAFSVPNVVERGKAAKVHLFGWNLNTETKALSPVNSTSIDNIAFERQEVEIPATATLKTHPDTIRRVPSQAAIEGFAFHLPESHAPILISTTDAPVIVDPGLNRSPDAAADVPIPVTISGILEAGDETDWYAIQAKRGEVIYFDGFGQRLQSPVDLQINLHESSKLSADKRQPLRQIAQFNDEVQNLGGSFPTHHLDPTGRWTCPVDGRYLVSIRNLSGGLQSSLRRLYRLDLRREEPDFQLAVIPHASNLLGLNTSRGGRLLFDVLAFRQRGFEGVIRVTAKDLPVNVACPDVYLGPQVDRAVLALSIDRACESRSVDLHLEGVAESVGNRSVRFGTPVRSGSATGWGRLTSQLPVRVTGDALFRITADAHEELTHHLYGKLKVRHFPGSVVDIAVEFDRLDAGHQAPVRLICESLPLGLRNATAEIPAGQNKGYVSLYLPSNLPVGQYSFVVRAETTVATSPMKTASVVVYSNLVTIDVQPPAFLVEIAPFSISRATRGQVIQIPYTATRMNGFIGKMHTELAAPGTITDIVGLRGRGETFVGQTESGSLQITVNEDAPLGESPFLRLFTVGVVEDEALYYGSCFLPLEIVE